MDLHPIGRRGAFLAIGLFVVALPTRLVGLSTPPSHLFDEVNYSRAATAYAAGTDVPERSHPPAGKLLLALGVRFGSGYRMRPGDAALAGSIVASDGRDVVWARDGMVRRGQISSDCRVGRRGAPIDTAMSVTALAVYGGAIVSGGWSGIEGPVLAVFVDGKQRLRVALPDVPLEVAGGSDPAWALVRDGRLYRANVTAVELVAEGVSDIVASPDQRSLWVGLPASRSVWGFDAAGGVFDARRMRVRPDRVGLAFGESAGSSFAGGVVAGGIRGLDAVILQPGIRARARQIRADTIASSTGTGLLFAAGHHSLWVVEPLGVGAIARLRLPAPAQSLLPDDERRGVVLIGSSWTACVSGDAHRGFRMPAAVSGALLVALASLLALVLTGRRSVAAFAGVLVLIDPLSFATARQASLDGFVALFAVGGWVCTLCAVRRWAAWQKAGGWVVAAAILGGLATATKIAGAASLAVTGAVLLWAAWRYRPWARWGVVMSFAVLAPLAYLATFVQHARLGMTPAGLWRLHLHMLGYHVGRDSDIWFDSGWYHWIIGARAIPIWSNSGARVTREIWILANPVITIAGFVALAATAILARRRHDAALGLVALAGASLFLPWAMVPRTTFLYHLLPVVPVLAVVLAWRTLEWRRGAAIAVLVLSIAAFAAMLPLLDGWEVPIGYADAVKRAGWWMFDPPIP